MQLYKDADKASQVVLEIIRQSAGDKIEGKTKIFKAFYFAHLFYALDNSDYLTEWPIVRMPNGPGIEDFNWLMSRLHGEGLIEIEDCRVGPYKSSRYIATAEGIKRPLLPAEELAAIRRAAELVCQKTCTELSDMTHEFSKSWNDAKNGDELPIYLDLLSDEDYRQAREAASKLDDELQQAWQ
jgi:hypothetical protein